MNILKYLFPCIALLFIISTEVYADDSDKKKCHYNDGEKCHEKMWRKKGMWKQRPMHKMFGGPMMGMGGPFTMIEAQNRLFLYNKKTGDVWVCNAFKKICEQLIVENKDK
jgi:hypothetical protein|tara:strand:+ start:225 stop:554 length:330 start_codon:yes stop_codon:yes gene_type:complete